MRRVGLPPGGSILITSAPRPARVRPQYSACSSASSMTRMPVRGPRDTSPWAAMIDALQSSHHAMRGAYVDGSRQDYILFGRVGADRSRERRCGSSRLLLQLDGHPGACERELDPLRRRDQLHLDAVLVLERCGAGATARGSTGPGRGIVPLEILDLLQVLHITPRGDLRDAEVDCAQPFDREGILLAPVLEHAVAPAHADPDRDRLARESHLPRRRPLRPDRRGSRDEGYREETDRRQDRCRLVHQVVLLYAPPGRILE